MILQLIPAGDWYAVIDSPDDGSTWHEPVLALALVEEPDGVREVAGYVSSIGLVERDQLRHRDALYCDEPARCLDNPHLYVPPRARRRAA